MKANSSLCFSKRLRQMLLYTDSVKVSLRFTIRCGSSLAGGAELQERINSWVNHGREY